MMAEDVQSQDHNTFQRFLTVCPVSGDCRGVASYQLIFQYAGQRSNVADQGVLSLLMHQILYILQQESLYQISPEQPYRDIYQTNGMKSWLHFYFLSLLS